MASVHEIPIVKAPVRDGDESADALASTILTWAPVEVPRAQRPSAIVLAVLGTVAGVAAMALGAFAVVSAGSSSTEQTTPAVAAKPVSSPAAIEARALALVAKPSTERIVFRGSAGRLVLAVGSGGRAAILMRGLPRRSATKPYNAWVVTTGAAPVHAARFVGTERAVFLSRPVRPASTVVVSVARPAGREPTASGFIAIRSKRGSQRGR